MVTGACASVPGSGQTQICIGVRKMDCERAGDADVSRQWCGDAQRLATTMIADRLGADVSATIADMAAELCYDHREYVDRTKKELVVATAGEEEKREQSPVAAWAATESSGVMAETSEKHELREEVNRLMDIIISLLCPDTQVFLRELVSNAVDALEGALPRRAG